jgi:hypothetical protein
MWKRPTLLPFLSTPAAVIPVLVGGADLMIPGGQFIIQFWVLYWWSHGLPCDCVSNAGNSQTGRKMVALSHLYDDLTFPTWIIE